MAEIRECEAVLFDLDGVLVDSFEVWLAVVNAAAQRFGRPAVTREHLERIFGQGIEEDARDLYPGRSHDEIRAAYEAAMPTALPRMLRNPEAHAALRALARRGLKRAVVTNTQESLAGVVLRTTDLAGHVDACVALGGGLRGKPEPDLLLRALELTGASPGTALMVGDTDYDERAARAAGVRFLRYELRRGTSLTLALSGALGTDLGLA